MATFEQFILDQWTPLSHKYVIGTGAWQQPTGVVPSWVGYHQRRLNAYKVLQSYVDNVARHYLAATDLATRNEHREYGDANLLVQQILAALLGDSTEIVVDGADEYDAEMGARRAAAEDELVQAQADYDEQLELHLQSVATGDQSLGETAPLALPPAAPAVPHPGVRPDQVKAGTPTDDDLAANEEAKKRFDRQEWLRSWAKEERFGLKLIETERNAVSLGDGVYVIGWSEPKRRVRLRVFDPGFYFPVILDYDEDEFPNRVHIAWEVAEDEDHIQHQVQPGVASPAAGIRRVRRITWELRELPDGTTRRYPWLDDDDSESNKSCYMTDCLFEFSVDGPSGPDDFDSPVQYMTNEDGEEVHDLDLMVDFLPIVHVPNNVAILHHYGRSSLSGILQIIDDIQNADTDLAAASGTTGAPPITVSGTAASRDDMSSYGPGQVFELGADGKMDVLDTSRSLNALISYVEILLQRMATNARVPEAVLGKVTRGGIPSGIALALMFGPLQSMVGEMRLVRDEKYPILFRFVQRMAMAGGDLEPGEVYNAQLVFGSYLPVDRAAAVDQVARLLGAQAISREAAILMLIEAGFDLSDATSEVERIERRDFRGAVQLLDATGDEQAVRDYLGLTGPPSAASDPRKWTAPSVVAPGAVQPPQAPGQDAGPASAPVEPRLAPKPATKGPGQLQGPNMNPIR